MTHPLVEKWRKGAKSFQRYDGDLCADGLSRLLNTTWATPPSIEAFRAHAAVHGFDKHNGRYGYLRVKSYSGWVQASCYIIDPSSWEGYKGDETPYICCELFQDREDGTIYETSFKRGNIEWQWCGSDGIPVPPPEVK